MSKFKHEQFLHNAETYRQEIGRGNVPGAFLMGGFGERDIAVATTADLWPGPTSLQPFPPSTGIQMRIVSTSAEDGVAGTGLTQVEIHYLDADGNEQAEIVVLNGLTPVNTVATDIRFVQCFHAWDAGSTNAAVGNISLQNTAGTTTYSYIPALGTRCSSSARMVPKGKNLFLTGAVGGSASGAAKRAIIHIASNAIDREIVNGGAIFFDQGTAVTQDNTVASPFDPSFAFPELSIIKMNTITTGAVFVAGTWFGFYEDK